jgi:hypothetical protein
MDHQVNSHPTQIKNMQGIGSTLMSTMKVLLSQSPDKILLWLVEIPDSLKAIASSLEIRANLSHSLIKLFLLLQECMLTFAN